MGWSIDLVRPDLDTIFNGMGIQYSITHPETSSPTMMIRFEGDMLPKGVLASIVKLLPEFVYVHFWPNQTFPAGEETALEH